MDVSVPDMREDRLPSVPFFLDGVQEHPMTLIEDGFGRLRHAQVGACGHSELCEGLVAAQAQGRSEFVILSHSFEMLRTNSSLPDAFVVRRFDRLCEFLALNRTALPTRGFQDLPIRPPEMRDLAPPRARLQSTARRHLEQTLRRLL
jgi:hypothetical protein